jgi:type IV pilus assembly protein PilA
MSEFIKPRLWAEETPIGGFYNWEGPDSYPYAGLSIFSCPAPAEEIAMLDQLLDDGDVATGHMRVLNGRPTLIIEE